MINAESTSRKFHFLREIASGGFGSVYVAKVIHGDGFSRVAAIKLLHPKWSGNNEIASRMRDEARLLGRLRHKNIVDVMDLTMIDGRCAVIMEFLEAVDAKIIITACARAGAAIPLRVALEICAAAASALDAAYNRPPYEGERPLRVIHRDIKPSNVMVDDTGHVKVLDFGVARAEFDARESRTQELSFGSLEYMPPERLFFEPETPASDVYSLGATLFEMLALERFGKARLRPSDQEQFFEERFEDLLERHPLSSEEVEDVLHDLLYDMLNFDEAERPTAADCVARMRSFARRLSDEHALQEWAERAIPPLVRKYQSEHVAEETSDALIDRVLTEDTVGFGRPPAGAAGDGPEGDEGEEPVSVPTERMDGGDDEITEPSPEQGTAALLAEARDQAMAAVRAGMVASEILEPHGEEPLRPVPGPPPVPDGLQSVTPLPPPHNDFEDYIKTELVSREALERRGALPSPAPLATPEPPAPLDAASAGAESVPASEGGSGAMLAVAAVVAGIAALVVIVAIVVVGVGFGSVYLGSAAPDLEPPPPAPEAPPTPGPDEASDAPPAGDDAAAGPLPAGSARFTSLLPETKRVTVRCDGASGTGGGAVVVAGELGDCTVTAIDRERKRLTARVKQVEHREYACFAEGATDCS